MHKRNPVNMMGALLTILGVGLLIYVGIEAQRQHSASPQAKAQWSASDQQIGKQLASNLRAHPPVLHSARQIGAAAVEPSTLLDIPRIALHAPVVETAPINGEWEVADWAVGHLTSTPFAGQNGNAAFSAHDDIKGEIFKRISELRPGDKVILSNAHASYTYLVTSEQLVDPSDVGVLNPTATPTVTLISCAPYWVDTQRVIVQAMLKSAKSVA